MAQSAEMQITLNRTASNAAIARHDVDGIVRDMLKDYSIVTGRGQHISSWKPAAELFVSLEK